jgi:hypothetical protein
MFAIGKAMAVGRAVAGALCVAVAVGLFAGQAAMADANKMPVYMGVMKNKAGETVVKFVFSDVAQPGRFVPRQAFSIRPKDGNCNMTQDGDLSLPPEYTGSPVYDSAKQADEIPMEKLPNFLAVLAGAEMQRKGYAETDKESLPVAACTRKVWQAIVGAQ